MNVLREVEKGVKRCNNLLNNDVENAKRYKMHYREDVDILIEANEKYMKSKVKELENWCEASAAAYSLPQDNWFTRLKRNAIMAIANKKIDKIELEICRSGIARDDLKKIKSRFDGFIYLSS